MEGKEGEAGRGRVFWDEAWGRQSAQKAERGVLKSAVRDYCAHGGQRHGNKRR